MSGAIGDPDELERAVGRDCPGPVLGERLDDDRVQSGPDERAGAADGEVDERERPDGRARTPSRARRRRRRRPGDRRVGAAPPDRPRRPRTGRTEARRPRRRATTRPLAPDPSSNSCEATSATTNPIAVKPRYPAIAVSETRPIQRFARSTQGRLDGFSEAAHGQAVERERERNDGDERERETPGDLSERAAEHRCERQAGHLHGGERADAAPEHASSAPLPRAPPGGSA